MIDIWTIISMKEVILNTIDFLIIKVITKQQFGVRIALKRVLKLNIVTASSR